jgi:2-(1,2-epoxy-1,2-dihydrophenyl)acetyl-CoA isomerase
MYENLLYSVTDRVCHITLNRPTVYNALSPGLIADITAAMNAAGADNSVRVVVLTGAGEKAFCSGADLKAGFANTQAGAGLSLGTSLRETYHPMILSMRNLPKPIIGRINGGRLFARPRLRRTALRR